MSTIVHYLQRVRYYLARGRKAVAAVVVPVAAAVASYYGADHELYEALVALATALGVWVVPNEPAPDELDASRAER